MPYAVPADAVLAALGVTDAGLTESEVGSRTQQYGRNQLPEADRDPLWKRIGKHFDDVLIYILLGAAVLKAILGEWVDFGVILAVAVITALIGFIQEGRAEDALAGIKRMLSLNAQARRDGQWQEVPSEDLVPGDVVRLKSGDRVPADMRLLEAVNLRVEESALTGEAVPSEKSLEPVAEDAGVGDRRSMLFSGTLLAAGTGVGVVTATGAQAEIGRIQSMLADVEQFDTPLTRELKQFGKRLSIVILGMAAVMIVIGRVIHDFDRSELISAAIGFAVAAIPEGLPALVTITMALGVQQMAKRNAIMRNLPAVETLGAVTVVCSDKTGTLTKNEMTVRHIVTAKATYDVAGLGYQPQGAITLDGAEVGLTGNADLRSLVTVMAVANDSKVVERAEGWQVLGEPTEGALATLGMKAAFDTDEYPRVAVVPFESDHKYMATLNATPEGQRVILLKGAPDRVLDRCASQLGEHGNTEALNLTFWHQGIDHLGDQGLRVLAAAVKPADPDATRLDHDDLTDLTFVGLVGIVDPPRPEAIQAIATCHDASIRVKMITGDHAGTASAISREMGITSESSAPAVTGAELEAATDEQLRRIVESSDTFARTSPEHKLRLVRALQRNGEVVAMTGDGVNDAPALRRADVGVAMGIKGTEATKDAADMVLADDNFSTIELAIEEGRRIYDNLQKALVFLLPTNGAQSLVILVAVLFGLALPLDPVQILWINMVTAVTLSMALAYEPAEADIMHRPPRNAKAPLVSREQLVRVAYISVLIGVPTLALFYLATGWGWSASEAQTLAVTMLALGQVGYLFSTRALRESGFRLATLTGNPAIWIAVGALLVLQVGLVYLPFMNTWFNTAPLGWVGWALPFVVAIGVFVLAEVGKAGLRRMGADAAAQK
jgi:magnesium-transporting ATPase (P-type)